MSLIKRILWYFKPLKTTVANISITAPSRKLAGKRVIVTGGTRGLGYYIAKRFAAEGGEAHRRAIPCVRLTIAAFVSPYGNSSGNNPFSEAMNMIEALDFSI